MQLATAAMSADSPIRAEKSWDSSCLSVAGKDHIARESRD